ncbi:DUF1330 domain-containing protein [Vibrio profundum]|uniref:DUF1330 domain-containing protein n=1 Tax=Vibrio profundum TaxID=2910247 RepID=UPI003D13091A
MSAFMLANITVRQPDKFKKYLSAVQKLGSKYGAKLLIKGKALRLITGGACESEMTIVVKFPSPESIDELFESEEYRALIPLREEGAHIVMTSHHEME